VINKINSCSYDDYDDDDAHLDVAGGGDDSTAAKPRATLSFVKDLKNVTKEAGDFLKLKCEVSGTPPATSIQVQGFDALNLMTIFF
jgi:hypothetical protein